MGGGATGGGLKGGTTGGAPCAVWAGGRARLSSAVFTFPSVLFRAIISSLMLANCALMLI